MRLIFSRFGGKKTKSKEIIGYFPEHQIYVEPFLGSGAIFLDKDPVKLSVLNDLDPLIYNIFNLTKKYGDEFDTINKSGGFDWTAIKERWESYRLTLTDRTLDPCELLYRSLYVIIHSWSGRGSPFSQNRRRSPRFKRILSDYKDILKTTHIYQEDYLKIIKYYDTPDTFFYLDPPYDVALKNNYYEYDNEMTLEVLSETLKGLKGKFCLSLDITPKTTELFKDFVCYTMNFTYRCSKSNKDEYLITNYTL